jgi:pSer/pThr/pTyr-binding forkhead associated (FHA) protein
MAKLVLTYQGVLLREFPLKGSAVTIGRTDKNDVRVDHPTVSSRHAQVEFSSEGFILTDLGSRNGTFVNGRKVQRAVLRPNDWISVGNHVLVFKDSVADRRGQTESIQTRVV